MPVDRSLSPPFSSGVLLPDSWELYGPEFGILMLDWGRAPEPPVPPPTERVLVPIEATAADDEDDDVAPEVPCAWYLIAAVLPLPLLDDVPDGRSEPEYARVRPLAAGLLCLAPMPTYTSLRF